MLRGIREPLEPRVGSECGNRAEEELEVSGSDGNGQALSRSWTLTQEQLERSLWITVLKPSAAVRFVWTEHGRGKTRLPSSSEQGGLARALTQVHRRHTGNLQTHGEVLGATRRQGNAYHLHAEVPLSPVRKAESGR